MTSCPYESYEDFARSFEEDIKCLNRINQIFDTEDERMSVFLEILLALSPNAAETYDKLDELATDGWHKMDRETKGSDKFEKEKRRLLLLLRFMAILEKLMEKESKEE